MKIWYQSSTSYRYLPVFDAYGRKVEEQCRRAARPGTEVYVTGVPVRGEHKGKYKSINYFHIHQLLNNYLQAEKDGYDAVIIGCSLDPHLDEAREMLSIPVVGIAQASLWMAAMLGELFCVLTCEEWLAERYRQLTVKYGLDQKYMNRRYIVPITEIELAGVLRGGKQKEWAEKFKATARKAVSDGASVIVPVPAHISELFHGTGGLSSLGGATVLDPVAVAVKVAEMMVDLRELGIEVSRTLQVYGSPGKELLQKTLETYAPVFKIQDLAR